ncbi:siderophore-interacting protein [Caulobacter flavus]|uniref:Siderophore-interacting protein n=1 Tax=Caulobacter flavus TaxID=1679497 RepID=A0A2N5CL52_9CAUL|nr:siderophore-interacting protein [Caulobacter flavus]AYV48314.1 siderophore-interacting protein [Caulobacter flavus]PLR06473.1 siderophore-interacting protein [Caulobacter flavus]
MTINPRTEASPGGFGRALIRLMMRPAWVASCELFGDRFRLVTLEGVALRGICWTPGQKIQVAMGSAFLARTYTPMTWDAVEGRTRFLGYAHGEGPGSDWLRSLRPGAPCDLFGPRPSLSAEKLSGPLVVFGDETSFGLAGALAAQDPARSLACVFEVTDLEEAGAVLEPLGLSRAALFRKRGDDAHLDTVGEALSSLARAGASFVLTGRAAAIQRLRLELKRQAVAPGRIVTKAYWAQGKTGLD